MVDLFLRLPSVCPRRAGSSRRFRIPNIMHFVGSNLYGFESIYCDLVSFLSVLFSICRFTKGKSRTCGCTICQEMHQRRGKSFGLPLPACIQLSTAHTQYLYLFISHFVEDTHCFLSVVASEHIFGTEGFRSREFSLKLIEILKIIFH